MRKKINYKEISKRFILAILKNSNITPEALYSIMEIESGNEEELKKHIRAVANILTRGYNEIKGGGSNE